MPHGEPSVDRGLRDLSTAQLQLWTGQQLVPDSPMYNMAVAIRLGDRLDVECFRRAFSELVARCDALRTTFQDIGGRAVRKIDPPGGGLLEYCDLSHDPDAVDQLGARLDARTRTIFPLDGRLFDTALFKLADRRFVWYVNQHHLITDAWSTSLLISRMGALYRRAVGGTAPAVADDWPSYEAFVRHERDGAGTRHRRRAEAHWRSLSAGPIPAQPFYGRVSPRRSGRSRRRRVPLGADRSDAIRRLASRPELRSLSTDLSLFHVFATILLVYLHRVGDTTRPQIAVPSHNRGTATLRETMGVLIELFPLAAAVEPDDTFLSLARTVARANQERLVHAATGTSSLAPGSEVVLNYIKGGLGPLAELCKARKKSNRSWKGSC